MQEQNTEGPWEVSFSQINAGKHECIVQFGFNIRENPKAYANARLIAAAPELLEALQNLYGWMHSNALQGAKWPNLRQALDTAENAINKAKGE